MSLVNDLITEVISSSSDLSQVLRKARVLASELKSKELGEWADAELNGYKDKDLLPDYRVSVGSNFGNFVGSFGTQGDMLPIPLSSLPESWREGKSKLELSSGIAGLQEMLRSEQDYQEVWSADAVHAVSQRIYVGMNMFTAWKAIPKARVVAVLDAVRNRLLSFLLVLKDQHPEVETAGTNLQSIPKDDVRVNVVNNIYGGNVVMASGGTVHQQVQQGVKPGDLESLLSALREAALPEGLVDELAIAIGEDEPVRKDGIGPKVSRWLTRLGEKVVTSTAATFAAQALFKYYGLTDI